MPIQSDLFVQEDIMTEPVIADKKPVVLELDAGTYYWCSCGQSSNQPYCNGAHKGTDFTPMVFELAEKQKVALCLCKHTGNPPFCDGTHSKLEA
jgi:CDGSH iron-sulfur domain-containing protein 3